MMTIGKYVIDIRIPKCGVCGKRYVFVEFFDIVEAFPGRCKGVDA